MSVDINPEMRVKAAPGPADPLLVEQGWRTFLIKVQNEAGGTAELRVVSPTPNRFTIHPRGRRVRTISTARERSRRQAAAGAALAGPGGV